MEPLTDVVYFDVWSDCVVGRSLTGVIVRLGNWEMCVDREQGGEEGGGAKIEGDRKTLKLGNVKLHPVKAEQLSVIPARKHEETLNSHLMTDSVRPGIKFTIVTFSKRSRDDVLLR